MSTNGAEAVVAGKGSRATVFTETSERQIINLVEKGKSREEIAEIIGTTVGSLQAHCSRANISLRRPQHLRVTPMGARKRTEVRVESVATQSAPTVVEPPIADHGSVTPLIGVEQAIRESILRHRHQIEKLEQQLIGVELARKALQA